MNNTRNALFRDRFNVPGPERGFRILRLGVYLAVCWAVSSGCAIHRESVTEVHRALNQWERPRQFEVMNSQAVAARGKIEQRSSKPPVAQSGFSRLQELIDLALRENPTICVALTEVEVALEEIPQAVSLPDPFIRAMVRPEPIQTAAGNINFTLTVGQKIPLPAKLLGYGEVAAAQVRVAIERLNTTRLRVISDVERAYFNLYFADRVLEITSSHRQLLVDLEQVVTSQYQVGKIRQQDLVRIQTEISRLADDISRITYQRRSAVAALNRLLNRPLSFEIPKTAIIDPLVFESEVERLTALAREYNPQLAMIAKQVERDREKVVLADLSAWPDPIIGFEWTKIDPRKSFEPVGMDPININRSSETGADSWAVMVQFDVPLWLERISVAKREARLRLRQTRERKRSEENLVDFRVFDVWTKTQSHQDTIELLHTTLIPQAKQAYEVSLTAYQSGDAGFLAVIDNWRQLLSFDLMYHQEIANLETAFSQLQREVGLQLVRRQPQWHTTYSEKNNE